MKRTILERFIASAMTIVLAVGLMPLPAFAEAAEPEAEPEPELAAQASYPSYVTNKTIDGLGIGSIGNPQRGAGGWDRVYFGSATPADLSAYDGLHGYGLITPEEPVLFNVLNNHETGFSSDGEPTMLLDCTNVQFRYNPYHTYGTRIGRAATSTKG